MSSPEERPRLNFKCSRLSNKWRLNKLLNWRKSESPRRMIRVRNKLRRLPKRPLLQRSKLLIRLLRKRRRLKLPPNSKLKRKPLRIKRKPRKRRLPRKKPRLRERRPKKSKRRRMKRRRRKLIKLSFKSKRRPLSKPRDKSNTPSSLIN